MKAQTTIIALLLATAVLSDPYIQNCVNDVKGIAATSAKIKATHVDIHLVLQLGDQVDHAIIDCGNAYRAITSPQCKKVVTDFLNNAKGRIARLKSDPKSALGDVYSIVASGNVVGSDCLGA